LGETQAVPCEGVEMGGPDLAAITAKIRIAQIVRHDEEHIGFGVGSIGRESESEGEAKEASGKQTSHRVADRI
jgi:hypothetical protein